MADFRYTDLLPLGEDKTVYRKLTSDGVSVVEGPDGQQFLKVAPEVLTILTKTAMFDISHFLRPSHIAQVRSILDDPEASDNDKFVALELLRNLVTSSRGILPMCQDTGTGIISAHRGQRVLTQGPDEEAISLGVYQAFTEDNLRYSMNAPISMWEEQPTENNLPAQIEIYADTTPGTELEYHFMFMAKGGGSANKSFLFQETKAVLNPASLEKFLDEKIRSLGTAACPPYHLGIVIGGTSAEHTLRTAKYAAIHYLDELPTSGDISGHGYRDLEMEKEVLRIAQNTGLGAQFGGKYLALDARVIRMPRHGASMPVAIAVSCSADRQCLAKITPDGVFIEQLETNPAQYLPEGDNAASAGTVVDVDLNRPMADVLAQLSQYPVGTRLALNGTVIVGRDIAHAKIKERLDAGEPMPQYLKDHPIYYAGPAKTPAGYASGSFGPTTAGRMDSYVAQFQAAGGSMIMLAKGNRSKQVTDACKTYGGFYLGTIGGAAAQLAEDSITKVEVLEYPELGMEAVWRIEVHDFAAFIIVDDKGNDMYAMINEKVPLTITKRPGL